MTEPFMEHYPGCFGCGSANDRGLRLRMRWGDGRATGECVIPRHGEGAPDIAHGGYVAAIVDEAMALIGLAVAEGPTMTARLEIDYLRPTPTNQPVTLRGWAEEVSGRRILAVLEGSGPDAKISFRARGRLMIVATDRWLRPLQDAYLPDPGYPSITLGLELLDAVPRQWTIHATSSGLTGERGLEAQPTVVYRGPAGHWHDLSRGRRSFDDVTSCPDVRVDGDISALRALVDRLDFAEEQR